MNKKKLSVVMAGAMLASSVSPVLAAEVTKTEISASELGLLVQKVRTQLTSKVFSKGEKVDTQRNAGEAGKSVYYVVINGTKFADADIDLTADGAINSLQDELQKKFATLKAGDKVEIYSKGFVEEEDGKKIYATTLHDKYTKADLEKSSLETEIEGINTTTSKTIVDTSKTKYDSDTEIFTIAFDSGVTNAKTVELKEGSTVLDFTKYVDSKGSVHELSTTAPNAVTDFYGFATKASADLAVDDIAKELVETITITSGGNSFNLSDLYDGLMLTEKGQSLLNNAKSAKSAILSATTKGDSKDTVKIYDIVADPTMATELTSTTEGTVGTITADSETKEYKVAVKIADAFKVNTTNGSVAATDYNTYYITATNKAELTRVLSWLDASHASVDVLAGDNRYETAVNIAKETALLNKISNGTNATTGNIVLVNGDSLVDGLSAAPLASHLAGANANAPILLTKANELPKETKAYLRTLLSDATIGGLKSVTINIVGGTSVVSKAVEKELRAEGFEIKRFAGDNREETSLAVAREIGTEKGAFVVGAEGEADAMSIAGVAAKKGADEQAPIIVAKKGGLTEDAMLELEDVKTTVIGGENAVSASDYNALATYTGKNNLRRISGENRKATNAAVIKAFYTLNNTESVIVAKDGQNNKSELIDALTAANLASVQNAPVVLGTNNLSDAQINALELNAKSAKNVYQVGYGVARDVVKTVAQNLGLANR